VTTEPPRAAPPLGYEAAQGTNGRDGKAFAAVRAAMSQVGADVVITRDAANTITLSNVNVGWCSHDNKQHDRKHHRRRVESTRQEVRP
jgi:hypothetical protein